MVIIYTLEGCEFCKELKKELGKGLISYSEVNADDNYDRAQKLEDYLDTKSYPIIHIKKINKDIFIIGDHRGGSYHDNVLYFDTIQEAVHLIKKNI